LQGKVIVLPPSEGVDHLRPAGAAQSQSPREMIMTITLHVFPPSPRSFKVLLAAEHFKVPYEMKLVNLGTGEQKSDALSRLNLNQRVPVLTDGDFALWESNAILEYLASVAADGKHLPKDVKSRLQITKWLYWESAHWDSACAVFIFERVVKRRFNIGAESAQEIERGHALFKRLAPVLDEQLSRHSYIAGAELTIADFAVAAPLCVYEQAQLPLADKPAIQSWMQRLRALPAWQAACKLQALI
jgi:glutathione S-transferase